MKEEDLEKCTKCGGNLFLKEIEVYGEFKEVGAFCDNHKCERYMVLMA